MMRYVAFLLVALATIASLAPESAAQLKLNEILADPATDWNGDGEVNSKLDEWVEVMNVGNSSVDLSDYALSDETAGTDFRFALTGLLAPGEVRVFYGSEVVAWQSANGVSAFGLSLNNSGDTVYLYDVSGSSPSTVDSYTYTGAVVLDDRAVGRMPSGSGDWVVFDGMNPYNGNDLPVASGCLPSPGATTTCATPVDMSSWGAMKSTYAN